jgi:metal-responsive CopG/Arc/MetJ family transcriptional regulator
VNFNCPPELLEQFDKAIKGEYGSRTDAFLDLMRHLIEAKGA